MRVITWLSLFGLASLGTLSSVSQDHLNIALRPIEIRAGRLTIVDAKVISIDPQSGDLKLAAGLFTLRTPADKVVVSGRLVQGSLKGSFELRNRDVIEAQVTSLRLQLQNLLINQVVGGRWEAASGQIISSGMVKIGAAGYSGTLFGSSASSRIRKLRVVMGATAFNGDSEVLSDSKIAIKLDNSSVMPTAGKIVIRQSQPTELQGSVDGLIPNHILTGGSAVLSGIELSVAPPRIRVAKIAVDQPSASRSDFPNIPIVATARLLSEQVEGEAHITDEGASTTDIKHKSIRAIPDGTEVTRRLNTFWTGDAIDPLLPTGDPSLRYIRLSALSAVYTALAEADSDQKSLYRVYVSTEKDLGTEVKTERIAAGEDSKGPKVCVVLGEVGGSVAGMAVMSLFAAYAWDAFVADSTLAIALRTETLAPRYGAPAAWVAVVTSKLIDRFTDDAVSDYLKGNIKHYCEVVVGEGPGIPKSVVLDSPAFDPNGNRNQQLLGRYREYVEKAGNLGVRTQPPANIRHSVLGDTVAVRHDYNTLQKLRAEAWATKNANDIKHLGQAEREAEQRRTSHEAEIRKLNSASMSKAEETRAQHDAQQRALDSPVVATPSPSPGSSTCTMTTDETTCVYTIHRGGGR